MTDTIRTYEIKTNSETFRMEISSDWKVTYGQTQPGHRNWQRQMAGGGGGSVGGFTLRVYESETKQRAIFNDVISFRDMSIPIAKVVENVEQTEESGWGGVTTYKLEPLELVEIQQPGV